MPYCQQCQLVHGEEHRFCQRCGQLLKGSSAGARPCARCEGLTFPGQKFCTDCGLPLRVAPSRRDEEEMAPRGGRPPLFYPRNNESRSRRQGRRPGRALATLAVVLIVGFGVYYAGHKLLGSRPTVEKMPVAAAPQDDMRKDVELVAEKIRSAHLNKDINKWLSCYDPAYPNLGRLESQMLELWKNYDVKEVSYRITNAQRQGPKQGVADIVWNIQIYDQRSKDYTLVRQGYKVTLVKEDGGWKIRDSKEEGAS